MTRYNLTETAEEELREILRYLMDRDGPARTMHVHQKFLQAFEILTHSPGLGYHRPALTGNSLRWWPVFRYLVLYDPGIEPLTILRILHRARDLDRIFTEEK